MNNSKLSWALAASLLAATPVVASEASAKNKIDGSNDMVCAIIEVVGCTEGRGCIQDSAKGFDLPELIILDAKKKVLRATYESGQKAVSPVKNFEKSNKKLILQGVENGHGWNIAIDSTNGHMSGATVGEIASFLVFGTCTTL